MAEETRAARARVERLLQCARDVYARRAELAAELVATTGLSADGVEAAWTHSLERDASEDELQSLGGSVKPAAAVLVVLSAHVFTATLRALALALAASARVRVKPSRRDPVLARELVAAWNGPELQLVPALPDMFDHGCVVHAYGSDVTCTHLRAALPKHVGVWAHGTGFAAAYISDGTGECARALAHDIALFDQRGCMSPRVVWARDALAFGAVLSDAMRALNNEIPRGTLLPEEQHEHARFRAAADFAEACWAHDGGMVVVGTRPVLPPTGRVVHVVPLGAPLPEAWRAYLTQVVCDGAAPEWMPEHARLARPGNAQSPPFDGPVDRRSVGL